MTEKSHTETKFHSAKTVMSFNYIGKIYIFFTQNKQWCGHSPRARHPGV